MPRFNGAVYDPRFDDARLTGQIRRVYIALSTGLWLTLGEIEEITGDPQASISAQIRHLRKERFGSHTIEKRPRGDRKRGLWEYRLILEAEQMECL
jgi:DNA-binding transcriptional regulator GbsR (MarR family)